LTKTPPNCSKSKQPARPELRAVPFAMSPAVFHAAPLFCSALNEGRQCIERNDLAVERHLNLWPGAPGRGDFRGILPSARCRARLQCAVRVPHEAMTRNRPAWAARSAFRVLAGSHVGLGQHVVSPVGRTSAGPAKPGCACTTALVCCSSLATVTPDRTEHSGLEVILLAKLSLWLDSSATVCRLE